MRIYANVKQAGSRRSPFKQKAYDFPGSRASVRELITFFVQCEVADYEMRGETTELLYLTEEEIRRAAYEGKVDFRQPVTDRKVNLSKAVEGALQSFEDGLVRLIQNDRELETMDGVTEIREGDVFTFIRLTFLAGRMW